ncbi:AAA family ATPase [Kitasatospora sp. NBC_00315]|uniref:AAA family ATPase n=1 Tax=Kitasatospora sp. NBC_00315 TaxID=2975963 RepID=UPI003248C790
MPLVGRATETEHLRGLIDRAGTCGAALTVRGAPGIGKSALLSEAGAYAADAGMRVLTMSGVEGESHLPYAGLQQLLHPVRAAASALPDHQRHALTAAVGGADSAVPDIYLVGLAVLNLLSDAAAGAPVLLVAEDAQWLDHSTVSVLAFVARRLESEPVVLLASIRDGFHSRLDDAQLPELALPPLTAEHAAELLDAHAPELSPELRQRFLAESAGNPLALTELPRATRDSGGSAIAAATWLPLTTRLERAFTARLSGLPALPRTLLQVAALNDGSSLEEVFSAAEALLGGAGRVGIADLEAAVRAHLVEMNATDLWFRHPLMRSAIHQNMSLPQRHAVHAALAEVLTGQDDRRSWHLATAASRPDERVAAELQATAARAERRGAVAAAVAALEHAARLSENPSLRAERLLRAADLAGELGDRTVVAGLLSQASGLDLSSQQRARLVWIRGTFDEGLRNRTADARSLAGLAETVAGAGDPQLAVRILWSAAQLCFWTEPGAEARRQVVAVAESLPADAALEQWLVAILAWAAPIERGAAVMDRLRVAERQAGVDARAERLLGNAALMVGAFDLAQRFSDSASVDLRSQGRLGLLTRALGTEAWAAVQTGDLNVAIPVAEESSRLARETGQQFLYGLLRANEAVIAAVRGDHGRAESLAEEAELLALPVGARPVLCRVQVARGMNALALGRFEEACAQLRRIYDRADHSHQIALSCYALADLADAAVHCGQGEAIRGIVRDMEATALRTPSPALHAALRFTRAVLADDDADALFAAALSADLTGWPFIRARTQLAYGEWLRRRRRAVDSRTHLRAARETFDALGAIPWSERARQELRASGERSRRRSPDARDRLTPQELQIVQMAAEGLTNREIGQRLYLSHRTVSSHLHRIFPKLGITSRSELASVVRAAGG